MSIVLRILADKLQINYQVPKIYFILILLPHWLFTC